FVAAEDFGVDISQLSRRIDSELVGDLCAQGLVLSQRIGRAAAAMQCRQPSCPQGFTQRAVRNLGGQRYDALLESAGPQNEIDAAVDRLEHAFSPAGNLIALKP